MGTFAIKPRLSEKTYSASQVLNVYVFDVGKSVNKQEIAEEVESQFDVTVTAVRTAIVKGKSKRTFRKGLRPVVGKRTAVKKAYVTLEEGDSLPVFVNIEEAEKSSEKTEQLAAKAAKKAGK